MGTRYPGKPPASRQARCYHPPARGVPALYRAFWHEDAPEAPPLPAPQIAPGAPLVEISQVDHSFGTAFRQGGSVVSMVIAQSPLFLRQSGGEKRQPFSERQQHLMGHLL